MGFMNTSTLSPATALLGGLLFLSACSSSPNPEPVAPVTVESEIKRIANEFAKAPNLELRRRYLETLGVALPPKRAFDEICKLLATVDGLRIKDPGAADGLVRHAGNQVYGGFTGEPELFEYAFERFEKGTSGNARQLGWLLAATGASVFQYELNARRIERILLNLKDPILRSSIFGNLGQCEDRATVLRVLRRSIRDAPPGPDQQFPGLRLALKGYSSVLDRERFLRKILMEDEIPTDHPLRDLYSSPESVPDSGPTVLQDLVAVGVEPRLTQFDMAILCSFLFQRFPGGILELYAKGVEYDSAGADRELRGYRDKVRHAIDKLERRDQR